MVLSAEDLYSSIFTNPSCNVVQSLDFPERCTFVKNSQDCKDNVRYINYLHILYCGLRPKNSWQLYVFTALLMSFCIIIYIILGCTVDKMYEKVVIKNFCPALKVLSRFLGLNEHLAGVTLLAFGNGSPDVIAVFSNLGGNEGGLVADLFGAAVYVICFIGGLLIYLYPFQLQPNNILRDACFFILGVLTVDYSITSDKNVSLIEAICILAVYLFYLFVIFLDQYFLKQTIKVLESQVKSNRYTATASNLRKIEELRQEAGIEIIDPNSRLSIDVDVTRKMSYNAISSKNRNLFWQFVTSLNPTEKDEWERKNRLEKFYLLVKSPIVFMLLLFLPRVDYEEERHGWSKLLNTIQIVLLPAMIFGIVFQSKTVYGMTIWALPFFLTLPAAIYVFFTTRTDIPPSYHFLLSFYGMAGSLVIIYFCAGEGVEILGVLGIVTNSSGSFLDCTLQSWGNSIVDLVSTLALARNGYPRMGFAACLGGPFFNSIFSIGGAYLHKSLDPELKEELLYQGALGENCVVFLTLGLASMLVWSNVLDFQARRSVGVYHILFYLLFFVYVLLGELEIIETFAPEEEEGVSVSDPR